ncbi:hypothetical protein ACFY93_00765 [Streptomyces sp. NPDC008313]|uniref:hypothetical protein n=1 Tax=Streptomyces sp. NPDC008313 TaxID=3364826 RepID=UPI0036F07169
MSDRQSWLIPKGADGGEFKYQVALLKSIATPLDESMTAARDICEERGKAKFTIHGTLDKSGAPDVTDAVNGFLDKWCHGLGTIVDDADVIVSALRTTINDFLATGTEVAYKILMDERLQQFKDDHPVTTWLEDQGITGEQQRIMRRVDHSGQDQNHGQNDDQD